MVGIAPVLDPTSSDATVVFPVFGNGKLEVSPNIPNPWALYLNHFGSHFGRHCRRKWLGYNRSAGDDTHPLQWTELPRLKWASLRGHRYPLHRLPTSATSIEAGF